MGNGEWGMGDDPSAPRSPLPIPPVSSPPAAPDRPPTLALRHELARKALHLTSATVPVAYALGAPRDLLLALLGVLVLVALLV